MFFNISPMRLDNTCPFHFIVHTIFAYLKNILLSIILTLYFFSGLNKSNDQNGTNNNV